MNLSEHPTVLSVLKQASQPKTQTYSGCQLVEAASHGCWRR